MALLKKQPPAIKKELLSVRIHPETSERLRRYCDFLESGAHHVVEQALEYAFRKDKEFQAWLDRNPKPQLSKVDAGRKNLPDSKTAARAPRE